MVIGHNGVSAPTHVGMVCDQEPKRMCAQMLKTSQAERHATEAVDPGTNGETSARAAKPVPVDVNPEPERILVVFDLKQTTKPAELIKDTLTGQNGARALLPAAVEVKQDSMPRSVTRAMLNANSKHAILTQDNT